MIDDENLHSVYLRFQAQAKLLLNRCKDRGFERFRRGSVVNPFFSLLSSVPLIGGWLSSGVHCSVKS
jgi:hypothetical protein